MSYSVSSKMDNWACAGLNASFWTCAYSLRKEAKLCDIILFVKGRKEAMVGYPAHKILLISASKYFKLLFEREDLRNYCHFPHLSEDGLFTVLDIVYGKDIADDTNFEDALMAARFLQVDSAVEVLEAKKVEKESKALAEKSAVKTSHQKALLISYNHGGLSETSSDNSTAFLDAAHYNRSYAEESIEPTEQEQEVQIKQEADIDLTDENSADAYDYHQEPVDMLSEQYATQPTSFTDSGQLPATVTYMNSPHTFEANSMSPNKNIQFSRLSGQRMGNFTGLYGYLFFKFISNSLDFRIIMITPSNKQNNDTKRKMMFFISST